MNSPRIVVFGDLLYDCFIWADRLPREGETVTGYESGFFAGGKGANQAVVCARLGAQVSMLGKVGADERGAFLLQAMRENGIDVEGVVVDPHGKTGTDCVHVSSDGKNAIIVAPLANETVTLSEVASMEPWFRQANTALFQLQINTDAVLAAMRLARKCGLTIILNPAPACDVPDELFYLADWVTPNETETEFFTGLPQSGLTLDQWCLQAAQKLHERGARQVVITLGARGAFYMGVDEAFFIPAFPIEAVDSTAAGDAFNGGLALRVAAGDSVRSALRYASACGAITAMRRGSMPSLPSAAEVETFLKNH